MGQTFAKTRNCAILGMVLIVAILAVGLSSTRVSADPCIAQLGYPTMGQQYYGYYSSNVQVTVPVSATCFFQAGQLYAVGTAYDTTYNANVGTSNAVLSGTYGGNAFSGQLQFNLPVSVQAHSVQFSVSIYSAQAGYYQPYYGGSPLTTTSATFVVTPSNYQSSYPYYPTYPSYNYYYGSYPYYNQPGNYYNNNNQHPGNYYYNNNNQHPGNYYYNNNNQHPGNYYYNNNNQHPGNYYYNNNNGGYYYNNNNNRHCKSNNKCTHP